MDLGELGEVVARLAERVAAIESDSAGAVAPRRTGDLGLVQSLLADVDEAGDKGEGAIVYAGAGRGPDGLTAFQMRRSWEELIGADPSTLAGAFAALGSPQRVMIVQTLLKGPATTVEITDALDGSSSGQAFHHLKELRAAGLVHQPARGTYAIGRTRMIPLLVALAAIVEVVGPSDRADQ